MADLSEIREAVERLTTAHEKVSTRNRETLAEIGDGVKDVMDRLEGVEGRVSDIEAKSGQPKKPGKPSAGSFKVHEVTDGRLYEIPHDVKAADVMPAADDPPPVSFERWLGAALIGEKAQDREALRYAAETKQLTTSTSGVLIPEQYIAEWIDLIRSFSALQAAGVSTLMMDAKSTNLSAVATDPTASWHSEAGAISVANPTFAARTLTAQTLVTRCQASLELSQDSPDFGRQLANVMARSMAAEIDRVGLVGSGTPPEPQGILGASGVNVVSSVGTIADYSPLLDGVKALLDDNVPLDVATRTAIMSPGVWAAFEALATGISSDLTQLPRPASLGVTRFMPTTAIDDSASPLDSTIFMGDFADVTLGIRREATVDALRLTTYASNLLVEFVGYARCDYVIRRPSSLVTLTGVAY